MENSNVKLLTLWWETANCYTFICTLKFTALAEAVKYVWLGVAWGQLTHEGATQGQVTNHKAFHKTHSFCNNATEWPQLPPVPSIGKIE